MKFKFKIQGYQTEAVTNTTDVFKGQPFTDPAKYLCTFHTTKTDGHTGQLFDTDDGYRNAEVALSHAQLLANLHTVQDRAGVPLSERLTVTEGLGAVNLDVEMETGTGKTYVYIKTMFELNRLYGWSKFIIVVPSVAIREGVAKSLAMLEDHFMEQYGRKARWFVYNSSNLTQIHHYSQEGSLSVMIINTQAFAASLKEDGRSKESRIIYSERDNFASRRPIDVIAANRPIIIMDEPQRMEGAATQSALKKFKPLFVINYSATHKTSHDTVYALDALDAYRERLVKRIKVVGFQINNLQGTSGYMYLDDIVLSPSQPPVARLEIEVKTAAGTIGRAIRPLRVGDSLFTASNELAAYQGYTVAEICPGTDSRPAGMVVFTNGKSVEKGQVECNPSDEHMKRVQIRETIKAHLEKECELWRRGIKCLSLFFIDKVENYRSYDSTGAEVKGKFQRIFEEEYARAVEEMNHIQTEDYYHDYLKRFKPQEVHRGYFSIDKKGRMTDTKVKRGTDTSDDASDYELILRDKERLLSFDEPTRFIFSHSALREGWDNPNVFQICTLRETRSTTTKRQEVGRGLRICVDRHGVRQDKELLGDEVHSINVLTVIANESYASFSKALQQETVAALRTRPTVASVEYFKGRTVEVGGQRHVITLEEASLIYTYLKVNHYIDAKGNITSKYHADAAAGTLTPLWDELAPMADGVTTLIDSIFNPALLTEITQPATASKIPAQSPNANFKKAEFQALWKEINHKYVYTVSYDSAELVRNVLAKLNSPDFKVSRLRYTRIEGEQAADNATEFGNTTSQTHVIDHGAATTVKYDLVGEIAKGANITRRTTAEILSGLTDDKFALYRHNPEEFISRVVQVIREQKATMIVDHITYHTTNGTYDNSIFTVASRAEFTRACEAKKHVTDYVVVDSDVERNFARELEQAAEVVVYAKLPRSFQIPTPVGNYAPDWAIALEHRGVKHIFFVAETKGSLSSMQLNAIENAKIACCKKLFADLSSPNVQYHKVTGYTDLIAALTDVK